MNKLRVGDECSVAVDTDDSCQHDRPVQLITEPGAGLISGSSLVDSGRCVWQVGVGGGQRVRLRVDVFRPGSRSSVTADTDAVEPPPCRWTLNVDGNEDKVLEVALCSRTNPRRKPLECKPRPPQRTCSLLLDRPEAFADEESPVFVVHYQGIIRTRYKRA